MKNINKVNIIILVLIIVIAIPSTVIKAKSQAATYSIKTVKETRKNDKGEALAVISYEKLILDGDLEAFKKINQSIKKDCDRMFKEYKENLFEYAQIDYEAGTKKNIDYYCRFKTAVTYNKNDMISLKITMTWYAGGVSNKSSYGLTYNLKTGDKLKVSDVLEGSSSDIKKKIITETKKYLQNLTDTKWSKEEIKESIDRISEYKLNDFKFFLKSNKVYICYDEYELIGNYYGGNIISVGVINTSK